MKKIYKILIPAAAMLFVLILTGCSESSTSYDPNIVTFELKKSLDNDLVMDVETYVSGAYNEQVTVIFRSGARDLLTVKLSPNKPEENNLQVTDGPQTLKVYLISMVAPTNFVPGTIHIDSEYTRSDGTNLYVFNGLVAAWFLN